MSLKRSNSSSQPPIDATNAQSAKKTKESTTIVLPDDAWSCIAPYVESETLPALACAGKTTRDTALLSSLAAVADLLGADFEPVLQLLVLDIALIFTI